MWPPHRVVVCFAPLGRKFVTLRVHPFAANNMSSPFEVLSEDDLLVVASLLPIPDVLRLSSTGQAVHATLMRSRQLWRTAAVALLGEPLVGLHRVAWKEKDCPRFYRRLLRAGRSSEHGLAYANKLRREVVATLPAATPLKSLICTTGHSATACGAGLVAVIGGWRAADPTPHLHCLVIDVVGRALRVPTLTQASASPVRRMRHASCAVRTPPWRCFARTHAGSFSAAGRGVCPAGVYVLAPVSLPDPADVHHAHAPRRGGLEHAGVCVS